jgi:hypothetical protein
MTPFAMPMVLAPRIANKLATRFAGHVLLAAGLATSSVGNLLFSVIARADLLYEVFVIGMLVACCGAGLLNGQTVKNLQNSVPENHAGMASGLASTTRFIGNLVSVVALLGAVLSSATRQSFTERWRAAGYPPRSLTLLRPW